MLINSTGSLRKSGPPTHSTLSKYEVSQPLDLVAANDNPSDNSLRNTLAAMASLVAVLGPQAAHAQTRLRSNCFPNRTLSSIEWETRSTRWETRSTA